MTSTSIFKLTYDASDKIDALADSLTDDLLAKEITDILGITLNESFSPVGIKVKNGFYPVTKLNVGTAIIVVIGGGAQINIECELEKRSSLFQVIMFDSSKSLFFHNCKNFKCLVIPVVPNNELVFKEIFLDHSETIPQRAYKNGEDIGLQITHDHPAITEEFISSLLKSDRVLLSKFKYENGQDAFDNSVPGDGPFLMLCEKLGFSVDESISLFIPIKQTIDTHKDKFGGCIALCIRGAGNLFYDNHGTLESASYRKGSLMYFDDTNHHFVQCSEKSLFLVGNVVTTDSQVKALFNA